MEGILTMHKLSLIFIKCIIFTNADSVTNLIEGQTAYFYFPYGCNTTDITLQYSYRDPFYRTINPQSLPLATYPESRYVVENKRRRHHCSIHLTINPLHRSDAGTYITQEYEDGATPPKYTRIGLNVAYPPGRASCELREESGAEGWGLLRCTAPSGNLPGHFECYQRGERLPPYTTPVTVREELEQTIWVRLSHPVFCCSSARELPTDRCECKDFIFHASNDYQRSQRSAIDPCPATTTDMYVSTTLQLPLADGSETRFPSTPASSPGLSQRSANRIKETVSIILKLAYGMIAGIFLLVIVCIVMCMKLCQKPPIDKPNFV